MARGRLVRRNEKVRSGPRSTGGNRENRGLTLRFLRFLRYLLFNVFLFYAPWSSASSTFRNAIPNGITERMKETKTKSAPAPAAISSGCPAVQVGRASGRGRVTGLQPAGRRQERVERPLNGARTSRPQK